MGPPLPPDTGELLRRADAGDRQAVEALFDRRRAKLRQMVAVRMDPRLAARLDPSDVVQDALAEAHRKLPGYLRDRPMPFYPWLRRLAWQKLVDLHRRHVQSRRRGVTREEGDLMALSEQSVVQLADRLAAHQTSPSGRVLRRELRQRVRDALDKLRPGDRELLVLVYLEQLSMGEAGAVLGVSKKAAVMRHLRALDRLRGVLSETRNAD